MSELKRFRFLKPDGEPLNPKQSVEYGVILPHFLPWNLRRCPRMERVIRARRGWCSMLYKLAGARCSFLVEEEPPHNRKSRFFTALNCKPAILPVAGSDNHVCRFKWCPFCRARLASRWYEKLYPVIKRELDAGGLAFVVESIRRHPLYILDNPWEVLLMHQAIGSELDPLLKQMEACGSITSFTVDNERVRRLAGPIPITALRCDGSSMLDDHIQDEDVELGDLRGTTRGIVLYSRRRRFMADCLHDMKSLSIRKIESVDAFRMAFNFGWLFRYPHQWPCYPASKLAAWTESMQESRLTTVRGKFYFREGETE
jgi:hypothetical protein